MTEPKRNPFADAWERGVENMLARANSMVELNSLYDTAETRRWLRDNPQPPYKPERAFADCDHAGAIDDDDNLWSSHHEFGGTGYAWSCPRCDGIAPTLGQGDPPERWFDDYDAAIAWGRARWCR